MLANNLMLYCIWKTAYAATSYLLYLDWALVYKNWIWDERENKMCMLFVLLYFKQICYKVAKSELTVFESVSINILIFINIYKCRLVAFYIRF